jgi:hypothetical protein
MVMQNVNTDCCFSHYPTSTMSSERSETRKKCSQNFYTFIFFFFILYFYMWFVAEKSKQRGPERNLYGDWIILLKEQFSFRITGFLDFVHCLEF